MPARPDLRETPYYSEGGASTRFYDSVTDADRSLAGDIDIYAALAAGRHHILELGAGTGRVAIALAASGLDVTALDIAPAMLAQAERKKAALAPDVAARLRFVRGDLTALALDRSFDAIFATYFTLAHLQPSASWKRALSGMAKHLAPGGIVALHLPIPEKMGRTPPPPDQPVFRQPLDDGRELILYVASQAMNEKIGRMDLCLDYVVSAGGREQSRKRERLTYFAGDPEPYAARAGLLPHGDPIPVGIAGFIHVFVKSTGEGGGDRRGLNPQPPVPQTGALTN